MDTVIQAAADQAVANDPTSVAIQKGVEKVLINRLQVRPKDEEVRLVLEVHQKIDHTLRYQNIESVGNYASTAVFSFVLGVVICKLTQKLWGW